MKRMSSLLQAPIEYQLNPQLKKQSSPHFLTLGGITQSNMRTCKGPSGITRK